MNRSNPETIAVILAAGKGTRMKADLAKVLFDVNGRPMIHYVLDAVEAAGFTRSVAVIGHQAGRVQDVLKERRVEFALQTQQLGTGHAVMMAAPLLEGLRGTVAVLAGDVPLIRARTLRALVEGHRDSGAAVTILTAVLPDASGYGRIVRDASGRVTSIVEHRDCTEDQLKIREINSSIYAFDLEYLVEALPLLGRTNDQGEFYLTDTVGIAFARGLLVEGVVAKDYGEVSGINTREQLLEVESVLRSRMELESG